VLSLYVYAEGGMRFSASAPRSLIGETLQVRAQMTIMFVGYGHVPGHTSVCINLLRTLEDRRRLSSQQGGMTTSYWVVSDQPDERGAI
jgi:hypothetical protein